MVQGPGHELLAGPAVTLDEDAHVRFGNLVHQVLDLLHLGAVVDELAFELIHPQLLPQVRDLGEQLAFFQGLGDGEVEFLLLEGLHQIVRGAGLHGLHDDVRLAQGREHEDGHVLGYLPDLVEGLQTVHVGHEDVEDDQGVLLTRPQLAQRILAAGYRINIVPALGEQFDDIPADALIVIDNQYPDILSHHHLTL